MSQGTSRFYMKIIVAIVAGLPLLLATGFSFETTIDRFGGIGLIHWFIGLGATGLGVLALWAGAVSHRDRRNLARYRA